MHCGKKRFAADVRDEIHAEEPVHREGRDEERVERNGNTNDARTSIPGEPMVLVSR